MGQIAEDYVEGATCSDCGCFFKDPALPSTPDRVYAYVHGYPVVCWDCWDEYTPKERKEAKRNGLQRALVPTI